MARKKTKADRSAAFLDAICTIFAEKIPNPHCELYYRTPYQLLVSVVLSAQATDKSVNRAMQPLYDKGFTQQTVLQLGISGLLEKIRSIGLAPTKAKNIYNLTLKLLEQDAGQVPKTRSELEALPGVGRKTANVILGELYREPTLAVDTHVFRVTYRLGLHKEKNPLKAEKVLLEKINPAWLPRAHHWFVLHGRYICVARKPKCSECILSALCPRIGLLSSI